MPDRRPRLTRIVRGLTATGRELYAESVRDESATGIGDVAPGDVARIVGRLTAVVLGPASEPPVFDAELFDGDTTCVLRWLGRRRVTGVEPGRGIMVVGRVATLPPDRIVIYNPWYELCRDRDTVVD